MTSFLVHPLAYALTEPPSWVILSAFSLVGLFVVFHRFWSLRNLDILLILAFIPGFMMVYEGQQEKHSSSIEVQRQDSTRDATDQNASEQIEPGQNLTGQNLPGQNQQRQTPANLNAASSSQPNANPTDPIALELSKRGEKKPSQNEGTIASSGFSGERKLYWGFLSLLICCGLLTLRMLWDTAIVRRPLLEPNLNSSGMLFIGASLLIFLMINIAMSMPRKQDSDIFNGLGPGNVLLKSIPRIDTMQSPQDDTAVRSGAVPVVIAESQETSLNLVLPRILAIVSNLVLIASILGIGYWHFGSFYAGVGTATLYLLLPYTAHTAGNVAHVVPGALLLLAILTYRQPFLAGLFLGCASGVVYYPFFLLPLWCSFYWQLGVRRFALGFGLSLALLIVAMAMFQSDKFLYHLGYMFGIKQVEMRDLYGIWGLGWHPIARIPIIVLYFILSISFVVWPAQKNLATLMSCSAGLMAAAQFWHGFGGGLFLAWFLPAAILTIFRPNLDYCVALETVRPTRKRLKKLMGDEPVDKPMAAA